MSVRLKSTKFFFCIGQAGQSVMMFYNQVTGVLSPVMGTFVQQPLFEMTSTLSLKDSQSNPDQKQSRDTISEDLPRPKKVLERSPSIRRSTRHNEEFSDQEQGSEYAGKSSSLKSLKKKKKAGSQNENRNIIPNIIQQIFSYLSKAKKSRALCEKIFRYYPAPPNSSYSVSRFYIYHKLIKENMNHYVNHHTLAQFNEPNADFLHIFSEDEQRHYLRITRVMISYFLNNISPLLTIKSRRMSKDRRIEHLKVRRFLYQKLKKPSFC